MGWRCSAWYGRCGRTLEEQGWDGLYTHTLFEFGEGMRPMLAQGLELGRSFVQPKYQSKHSLDYLWHGIGAFVTRYPGYRYLFGPASISPRYGEEATARLVHYYGSHFNGAALTVRGRNPFRIRPEHRVHFEGEATGDPEADFRSLREALAQRDLSVPTLYKHYTQAAHPEGVHFPAFNVDPAFGNCVDGFVLVDLEQLTEKKRRRYLGG